MGELVVTEEAGIPVSRKVSFSPPLSKPTVLVSLGVFLSTAIMRQTTDFIRAGIGDKGFAILADLIAVVCIIAFLFFTIRRRSSVTKTSLCLVTALIGLALIFQMDVLVERFHILEYGLLGWVATRDLIRRHKKHKGALLACIFCLFVGILDELFQKLLPYRVFDLRDMMFNGMGSVWGIALYFLS